MVPAPPRRRSPGIHIGAPRILQPPWKSGSWDSTDPPVRAPQPLQSLSPPPAPTASLGAQEGNLSPPGTQASELSARPPRIGETEPPPPLDPRPLPEVPVTGPRGQSAQHPLSPQGSRSPCLPPPPGAPGTGRRRPRPPPFGSRCPPLLTPQPEASRLGGRARVAMATGVYFALGTHSSRRSAPPPRPSNLSLSESGGPGEGDWWSGVGGRHRDTQRDRDL